MSWNTPTPQEAEDAYYQSRSKYYEAVDQKNSAIRKQNEYNSQIKSDKNQISSLSSQKSNFEKRLEGIRKIIKMMEGNGGWFSTNVPNAISKASSQLTKADASFKGSIKLSGGSSSASLESAFKVKTVEQDSNLSSALQSFKNEATRLEQNINNIKNQISNLNSQIESLNRQVKQYKSIEASANSARKSAAYDMNYYKKYMY